MAFAHRVRESVLQLTWSLWASRVFRWVDQYQRFLSVGRLNGIQKNSPRLGATPSRARPYHPLVGARSHSRPSGNIREGRRDLNSSRPAHLSLPLRALFGVEALRVFVLREDSRVSVRQMANEIAGFTKRAVQLSLEDLELAGVCAKKKSGNICTYSLEQRNPIGSKRIYRRLPEMVPRPCIRGGFRFAARYSTIGLYRPLSTLVPPHRWSSVLFSLGPVAGPRRVKAEVEVCRLNVDNLKGRPNGNNRRSDNRSARMIGAGGVHGALLGKIGQSQFGRHLVDRSSRCEVVQQI
jgi:hypothetical protein